MTEEERKKIVIVAINDSLKEYDAVIDIKNKLLVSLACEPNSEEWIGALCNCAFKCSTALTNVALAAELNFISSEEFLNYSNMITDITLKGGE